VLIVHGGGVLCILLIVKLAPQADRISGHTHKPEDFETIQEKLTTYSISTECVKAVVAAMWPVLIIVPRGHK